MSECVIYWLSSPEDILETITAMPKKVSLSLSLSLSRPLWTLVPDKISLSLSLSLSGLSHYLSVSVSVSPSPSPSLSEGHRVFRARTQSTNSEHELVKPYARTQTLILQL